ncbi:MAG: alpha/beta hydrolase [Chloroflexia bacterium]
MSKARPRPMRRLRLLILAAGLLFLLWNAVALAQARAMTHYSPGGERTPRIEDMTLPEKAWAVFTGLNVPRPANTHAPHDAGLEYETRHINASAGEELEAWYVPARQSRGIVLMFPGYAERKESLLPAAVAFHDLGYDALMVDFRGTGGSSGNDTTLGVREGTDVALSLRYAKDTWPGKPVTLYGVSMGAAAILRAIAAEGAQPDAIVLESPFDRLVSTVANRFHSMGLPAFPSAQLLVFWGSVQQGFNGFNHNPVDYARQVRCPSLLLHGDQDPRATPAQARSVFDNLSGPREFVAFTGARHESLVTRDPTLWKSKVGAFLERTNRLNPP